MNPIPTNIIIDHLCEAIDEAESEIEQCEECVSCMRRGIIENQNRIIYSEGVIYNAKNTLAQIGYEEDDEDFDDEEAYNEEAEMRKSASAFKALCNVINNPENDGVRMCRSDKEDVAFDVYLEKKCIKDVDEPTITVSINGE